MVPRVPQHRRTSQAATCMHTHKYAHTCTCPQTHAHTCTPARTRPHMHTRLTRAHTHIHTPARAPHACNYTHACTHTPTHAPAHTLAHTRIYSARACALPPSPLHVPLGDHPAEPSSYSKAKRTRKHLPTANTHRIDSCGNQTERQ